jgi:hypothetical protein
MNTREQDEQIGRIYRHKTDHRKRLSFVDAELSGAVNLFRKAATQLECLLAKQPSEVTSALSQLNIERILRLLAEREQLQRKISDANEELKRLGVRV